MTFKFKGDKEAKAQLLALATTAAVTAAVAVNEVAEVTMTDARSRTPVRFGILKDSGKVSRHATARRLEADLTYGTEYAIWVHERTELRHSVGEAKFLEKALTKTAATFVGDVTAKIRSMLR